MKQKLDLRRRQGLGTQHNIAAAREQMEQDVGAPSPFDAPLDASLQVNVADSITGKSFVNQFSFLLCVLIFLSSYLVVLSSGLDTNARNRKLAAEKQVALKKLFLQKEEVKDNYNCRGVYLMLVDIDVLFCFCNTGALRGRAHHQHTQHEGQDRRALGHCERQVYRRNGRQNGITKSPGVNLCNSLHSHIIVLY